jgi:uncharacterized protein YndB with AHSA1/START domain
VIDIVQQLNATQRRLGDRPVATGEGRSLHLRRTYDAAVEDVWDACTDPDRLSRWLAPVEGDLRVGGKFQLKDNAGGEILACEQPHRIKVTWAFGDGMPTEVEVRFTADGDGTTVLELEHACPAAIVDELVRTYGPGGTISIGSGWDLALLGLDLHLGGAEMEAATWQDAPEIRHFAVDTCAAWGSVVQEAWGNTDDEIAAAVGFAAQHFTA